MNRVILSGRLTKDPNYVVTQQGTEIVTFTIAVSGGEETTYFINVVTFNKTALFVNNYLKKGSFLTLEGRLTIRTYETKNGGKNTVTEVLADRVESVKAESTGKVEKEEVKQDKQEQLFDDDEPSEDDLPF